MFLFGGKLKRVLKMYQNFSSMQYKILGLFQYNININTSANKTVLQYLYYNTLRPWASGVICPDHLA